MPETLAGDSLKRATARQEGSAEFRGVVRTMGAPLLQARGLGRRMGDLPLLQDVSLRVLSGEVVAVIGPNGSGKTTLLRLLAGVLAPTAGSVLVDGQELSSLNPRERALRIGYLPQLHDVPAGFTGEGLVEMGRHPHIDEGRAARREAVDRALDAVGAAQLSSRPLATLSGGELQKIFLASVVAQETPLLILDEPTVFLDPGRTVEIQQALLGLVGKGRALVLATHDLAFARRFATRFVALKHGRVAMEGEPGAALTAAAIGRLYDIPADREELLPESCPKRSDERSGRAEEPVTPPPAQSLRKERRAPPASATWLLALGCSIVLVTAPLVGPSLSEGGDLSSSSAHFILWQLRVPRVLLAGLAGAGLALAGAAFQALFRNPLATPYTLGVASGAALGAVATILTGVGAGAAGLGATSLGALAGALGITAAAYRIGRNRQGLPTATLLLGGVTLGFFFSSLILLLQYFADFAEAFRILRWLLGEVRVVGYATFLVLVPLVGAGSLLVLARRAELNLLLTGEELAHARGADVERVKRLVFVGSSLVVAGIVSVCGPIGFVGLVVPHAARSILGPDLRRLLPACVPAGAAFLVVCDTVARLAIVPAELPVGVVTALVGGPVFLAILLRRGAAAS
jgi:iron complex transport system permease protein